MRTDRVRRGGLGLLAFGVTFAFGVGPAAAQDVIPHNQTRPPGKALSPEEAVRAMTVPEGFKVEVVASEPDLVNPVAMTFDEKGRVWVTESLEYPRREPGPGRDRVKVLEDTDGDGKADRFTVFAEGLNIPSGVAVGHGGVWVANSPDILFLQDTDGDGKADRREVVVTGFGRDDTHELPNSLSWGPDGWLYGWNGVFNRSHVEYRGKTYDFTCAVFRIHPVTRDFELFCEGTSNPWGITWDGEGSAFASACVIDHLWHLTETGYYHRQGGPYPPFTWKIESIVGHLHQKAAYCGIHYYDSDAYPAAYRGTLFMGNIHGNAVNADTLSRRGSTYVGNPGPDFLQANDAWFMPVAQKTGPDGSLYVLDWYDRYHCYQDANRDPAGIDRLKGRLYRVRYKDTPRRAGFDLAKSSDEELIRLLDSPNGFDRDTARRLLVERKSADATPRLQAIALDAKAPRRTRMNALWTLVSRGPLDPAFHLKVLADADPGFRAWGVRAAGNMHAVDAAVRERLAALGRESQPDVLLQLAVASRKVEGLDAGATLLQVATACGKDELIPHVVWQNLLPLVGDPAVAARWLDSLPPEAFAKSPALLAIAPRLAERLLAGPKPGDLPLEKLVVALRYARDDGATRAAGQILTLIAGRVQSGELSGDDAARLRARFAATQSSILDAGEDATLGFEAAVLAASWRDPAGIKAARTLWERPDTGPERRLAALNALIASGDPGVLDSVARFLASPGAEPALTGRVLDALGRRDDPRVAEVVLAAFDRLGPEQKPRAVELLTQRTPWARDLVRAVEQKKIPSDLVNVNQLRRLQASRDPELAKKVKAVWGAVREGRNPQRERVIEQMRAALRRTPGDPHAGARVFLRVCGQCHKIYGEGQDVGPEITLNGRASYDQLLSNVFDPSLVIGSAYQATTVATADGRVVTGLLVEDSPQRVVLKLQGGKVEAVPRAEVDEVRVSPLSLMPEDLEKQLQPQELADLFAFITLDKPPTDPSARPIPGAQEVRRVSKGR